VTPWHLTQRDLAGDANVVRAAAWTRLMLLVAAGTAASFVDRPGDDGLFLLIGLAWIPWATVVLLAADLPGRPVALLGGPAGDIAGLAAVQLLVPSAAGEVLFGYLVVVTFAAFTAGRVLATWLACAAIAVSGATAAAHDGALGSGELVSFSLAVLAALLMVRRSISAQALWSARAQGLRTKADVILATAVGGVVVTDASGDVLEANPAAELLLGSSDQAVGRACSDVLGLHAGARALDCRNGCPLLALPEHDAAQGVEVWRTGATGEKQPILARAVTLETTEGSEVVHSLQDITRLKQAEEAKTLFLATASHELKTPLTVINGFAETLSKYQDLDPETQRTALAAIHSRGKQLTRVVDRLLLSSRIDAGKVTLTTGPVALEPLLRERVDGLARATGRTVLCEVPDDMREVRAETDALTTVVDHLLDNALKYSPDGGDVTLAASEHGDRTQICIRDAGIGMDTEQAAHCFDKFWQAESTDVRRFGGTGIGLYIVHSLVEAMGGRIWVESAPGSGSAFTIELLVDRPLPSPREAGQIREFMRQIGVPSGGAT